MIIMILQYKVYDILYQFLQSLILFIIMIMEKTRDSCLADKFNIFSENNYIDVKHIRKSSQNQKGEIKLIFHHPNLLFLKSEKTKTREQENKEKEQCIIRKIQSRKECKTSMNTRNNKRPNTSYFQTEFFEQGNPIDPFNQRLKSSKRKKNTEVCFEICGKSTALTNCESISPTKSNNPFTTLNSNSSKRNQHLKNRSKIKTNFNVFTRLQSKQNTDKNRIWRQLLNKPGITHSIKLNMYLDAQKTYLKYAHPQYSHYSTLHK